MKKLLVGILIIFFPLLIFADTQAVVEVTAILQGLSMSLSVTDIQMTGKSGGTPGNNILEFGTITSLSNGKYATCPEVLKINWEPKNNSYYISVYTSNSNANYNVTKFKDNTESGYWDLGSEANGLVGTNNSDYIAAMLWSCHDDNVEINLTDNTLNSTNWTYFKDYYTHLGESASGLLLSTNSSMNLSSKLNYSYVTTPGNRPMETWNWTWKVDWSYDINDENHYIEGVDATGYRKILYGLTDNFYTIATKNYSESEPATDRTVYLAVGANFESKPAQTYRCKNLIIEILSE